MYFPYLRGRQNELLALRELARHNLLGNFVIPIIEPVKMSSTLISTIIEFIDKASQISIVRNPSVGSFYEELSNTKDKHAENFFALLQKKEVINAHIIGSDSSRILNDPNSDVQKSAWLVVNSNRDYLPKYEEEFEGIEPKYILIPDERIFRRRVKGNRVLFDDKFEKQLRNSDYSGDGFFSDDHLYFFNEKFKGFSDYSIVGQEYLEAGFAPYAVAIHIVYFDKNQALRIRHFVSDSNDDIQNPAKKFYEAVKKLSDWYLKCDPQLTLGLKMFLNHFQQQTYPGLGVIKKLSIMHHLELMAQYLTKENEQ